MNVHQFNFQPIDQRAELVWEHGQFLSIRYNKGCSVVLYHMGDFFAEMWYSQTKSFLVLVHGFENLKCLEPYLAMIDLEELME